MEIIKDAVECKMCREILDEPVALPCGHLICQTHTSGVSTVDCFRCNKSYTNAGEQSYPRIEAVANLIRAQIQELRFGKTYESAVKSCAHLRKILDEYDRAKRECIIYGIFDKALQRDDFKEKIKILEKYRLAAEKELKESQKILNTLVINRSMYGRINNVIGTYSDVFGRQVGYFRNYLNDELVKAKEALKAATAKALAESKKEASKEAAWKAFQAARARRKEVTAKRRIEAVKVEAKADADRMDALMSKEGISLPEAAKMVKEEKKTKSVSPPPPSQKQQQPAVSVSSLRSSQQQPKQQTAKNVSSSSRIKTPPPPPKKQHQLTAARSSQQQQPKQQTTPKNASSSSHIKTPSTPTLPKKQQQTAARSSQQQQPPKQPTTATNASSSRIKTPPPPVAAAVHTSPPLMKSSLRPPPKQQKPATNNVQRITSLPGRNMPAAAAAAAAVATPSQQSNNLLRFVGSHNTPSPARMPPPPPTTLLMISSSQPPPSSLQQQQQQHNNRIPINSMSPPQSQASMQRPPFINVLYPYPSYPNQHQPSTSPLQLQFLQYEWHMSKK